MTRITETTPAVKIPTYHLTIKVTERDQRVQWGVLEQCVNRFGVRVHVRGTYRQDRAVRTYVMACEHYLQARFVQKCVLDEYQKIFHDARVEMSFQEQA